MGACGPPGASRCCARASLRTPSRPHPPLEVALRAILLERSGNRAVANVAGQHARCLTAEGKAEVRTRLAGGRRGKERAARHERSSDWRPWGRDPRPRSRIAEAWEDGNGSLRP